MYFFLFLNHFQIASFGSVTEVIPSLKPLPSVHIYVNKETTFTDLKVNVISIIIIIIIQKHGRDKSRSRILVLSLLPVIPTANQIIWHCCNDQSVLRPKSGHSSTGVRECRETAKTGPDLRLSVSIMWQLMRSRSLLWNSPQ